MSRPTTGWKTPVQDTVSFPQGAPLCAAIVFLISLAVYCWTLAPTVTLTDSGELMVVARFLGVAHPPGVPLWIILAHLISLLPLGSVASRINFSSAIFAALSAAMLTLTVAELIAINSVIRRKPTDRTNRLDCLTLLFPAVGAGLLLTFSRTLWSYATITEVYALNTLLIVAIVFLMIRWRRCVLVHRQRNSTNTNVTGRCDFRLYLAATLFGLALGVHHVTVALILPALALLVYRTEHTSFFGSRKLLYAALCSTLALFLIYTYLPLAASRDPVINWGNPRSLQEIWWHVSGRQYQVFLEFSIKSIGTQSVQFIRMAVHEFGWPWLPFSLILVLVGFVDLWKRDRTTFWTVSLVIVANLAYALTYEIAEDKDAYYLPAFIAATIVAGFGFRSVISTIVARVRSDALAVSTAVAVVLLSVFIAVTGNWAFNNRRHYFIAHDYVNNLLHSMEPDGLLLTLDWQVVSPMFYTKEIERLRPDTSVIDVNLLRRPWYFRYLRHACPELVARSATAIQPFEHELDEWEHNPQLYATDPERNRQINTLFYEMLRTIVTNEAAVGPVYVTLDLLSPDQRDAELSRWLNQNYQFVPRGLVFLLTNDSTFQDVPEVKLETRGLADGTIQFDLDDPVKRKVLPAYTGMLINRGRYLSFNKQPERAIAAYEEALRLDSTLPFPKQEIEKERARLAH
jgi:hypothetical protein